VRSPEAADRELDRFVGAAGVKCFALALCSSSSAFRFIPARLSLSWSSKDFEEDSAVSSILDSSMASCSWRSSSSSHVCSAREAVNARL
jgi:hypothetical protein